MANTTVSLADAKTKLSEYVRAAESGSAIVITRHGRAVAALVGANELAQLERLRAAGPEGGLASIAGGWEDSDELVDRVAKSSRTTSRETPSLD